MRRFSAICMAALLVFVMSCKKKEAGDETGVRGFRAFLETQADGSKTHLEDGVKVKWDASDAILVINNENVAQEFITATGETSDGYADFEANVGADFFTPKYMGFYPSTLYNAETNMVTLPETQQFALVNGEGSFGKGFSPMVAQSTDDKLEFKNICGMLALQFVGEGLTVSKITLTSNTSEMLCGTAQLTMTGDDFDMTPALGTLSDGSNHITLNCGSGVQLDGTVPTMFYFVLPANTLSSGFNVKLTFTNAEELNLNAGPGNNTLIQRNKIKFMMPLDAETGEAVDPVPVVTMTEGCKYCTHAVQGVVTSSWAGNCEFGFVYSATEETPTIENATKLVVGTEAMPKNVPFVADLGEFFADPAINGQTCYVRAYAQVPGGSAAYCDNVVTMTSDNYPQPSTYEASSSHMFSISSQELFEEDNYLYYLMNPEDGPYVNDYNEWQKHSWVYFSPGNLYWDGSQYQFEEHQYDSPIDDRERFVSPNGYTVANYDQNHVTNFHFHSDFEKARSGLWSQTDVDECEDYDYFFTNGFNQAGWPIDVNPEFYEIGDYYRVLNDFEWDILLNKRENAAELRGVGRLGNCPTGLILLCDRFWDECGDEVYNEFYSRWKPYGSGLNTFTYVEWAKMEAQGAVFIPFGGVGQNSVGDYTITDVWKSGSLWLADVFSEDYYVEYEDDYEYVFNKAKSRSFNYSPTNINHTVERDRMNALIVRPVHPYSPSMK